MHREFVTTEHFALNCTHVNCRWSN